MDLIMLIEAWCQWPSLCNRIVFTAKVAGSVMWKIAAHQNTASDSITFMNTFPVDTRMTFAMTRQHVAVCSTRRSLVIK